MGHENTLHTRPGEPVSDIAYLARSHHRLTALVALTERPRSRAELCELTDVSASTMRRTLGQFEDWVWIRREGHSYTATRLGAVVASGMEDLVERVETARKLRDLWHWLPDGISECSIETLSAMTTTVAEPDAPYRPVNRFESLLEGTDHLRFVRAEIALVEPCFDLLAGLVDDGAEVELVARPESHTYFLSTYPERSAALLRQNNFTVLEHDGLPRYGTGVLDEHVVISRYERDSGTVKALIDTDVPAVREWALSACEAYASDARVVEPDEVLIDDSDRTSE